MLFARRALIASWFGFAFVALAACQTDNAASGGDNGSGLGAEITDIIADTRTVLSGVSDQATAEEARRGLEILNGRLDTVADRVAALGADARRAVADAVDAGLPLVRRALDNALEAPDTADAIRPLVEQIIDKLTTLAA